MMPKIPLIIICGPTAVGKTRLAVDVARNFGGEVISADSMQVYRHMNIGTAKPTTEEMDGIPHHLINLLEPTESFSVAQYAELAREYIANVFNRGSLPIMVGGTGLYIQAIADNIKYTEMAGETSFREQLRLEAIQQGNKAVWEKLRNVDPGLAETLHPNNLGRVIRGLEVFHLTGIPMSSWQQESKKEPSPYNILMLGLSFSDRERLYERINLRIDQMLKAGILEELRHLIDLGFSGTAAQAIGYKEMMAYLDGSQTYEEAVECLKMETRRYAKRQMTWLRRDERIYWLEADREYCLVRGEAFEKIAAFLEGTPHLC